MFGRKYMELQFQDTLTDFLINLEKNQIVFSGQHSFIWRRGREGGGG